MSRADGLHVWADYLAGFDGGVALDQSARELLLLTIQTAIVEIETMERPEKLERLAAKAARELATVRHADAVAAAAKCGKLSVLAAYRMRKGQGGRA